MLGQPGAMEFILADLGSKFVSDPVFRNSIYNSIAQYGGYVGMKEVGNTLTPAIMLLVFLNTKLGGRIYFIK